MNAGHWLSRDENAGRLESKILKESQGWKDGYFPRRPGFNCQHPGGSSQLRTTSVPGHPMPFSSLSGHYIHMVHSKYNKNDGNKKF